MNSQAVYQKLIILQWAPIIFSSIVLPCSIDGFSAGRFQHYTDHEPQINNQVIVLSLFHFYPKMELQFNFQNLTLFNLLPFCSSDVIPLYITLYIIQALLGLNWYCNHTRLPTFLKLDSWSPGAGFIPIISTKGINQIKKKKNCK